MFWGHRQCFGGIAKPGIPGEDFSVGARLLLSSVRLKELSKVAARMDATRRW